jgi:hypothetical protein
MQLDENGFWIDPGAIQEGEFPFVCEPECVDFFAPQVAEACDPTDQAVSASKTDLTSVDSEAEVSTVLNRIERFQPPEPVFLPSSTMSAE